LLDLAKCEKSDEQTIEALLEQQSTVPDYGEVARDWNYSATTICAESAFIFHEVQRAEIYYH